MSTHIVDRGPTASIKLHFDGSASPNPGPAGCGATATIRVLNSGDKPPTSRTIGVSLPLGYATNNAAEYLGLIAGLRAVLAHLRSNQVRHTSATLAVYGDSEVVVNHMSGRARVNSPNLAPLHIIAQSLTAKFHLCAFRHVPRSANVAADRLAKQARQSSCPAPVHKAIYYPGLISMVDVYVHGQHTPASHDLGTAGSDPSCFIDLAFLRRLPGGDDLVANLQDPGPLSTLIGKVNMNIVGSVVLPVSVAWMATSQDSSLQPPPAVALEFSVVDSLPVPVHISVRHPAIGEPREYSNRDHDRFEPCNLPEEYANHRYWHSDTFFLGIEDSALLGAQGILSGRQLFEAGVDI